MKSEVLVIGRPAPALALPTSIGAIERLSDHLGRNILLLFYRGHWCPVCRRQLGQLRDASASIERLHADILAVSTESPLDLQTSAHAATLPFPLLSDADAAVTTSLGLAIRDDDRDYWIARPATVLIDRQGTIQFAHIGEHPRDRPALGAILLALEWMNKAAASDREP